MAHGINPIDDSLIPDDGVINNVRLSRCLFYVSDILRQVIDNGGITPAPVAKEKKPRKQPYSLTPEQVEKIEYSDTPIPATELCKRIVAAGPQEGVKRFPQRNLIKWLLYFGFIEEIDNTRAKCPTAKGKEIGILQEERQGQYGSYYVTLYNREAQQFIVDNIEAILSLDNEAYRAKMNLNNQGKPWDSEQDEKLISMFKGGASIGEIAQELQRGERAIIIRLRIKGIDPDSVINERPKSETEA